MWVGGESRCSLTRRLGFSAKSSAHFTGPREHRHMPVLTAKVITKAWRHADETGKIHCIAVNSDGKANHLIAKEGQRLYDVLDEQLQAIGYAGPKSNEEH